MKIKKNSWHYWLLSFTGSNVISKLWNEENVTLCTYFWYTVKAVLVFLSMLLGVAILIVAFLFSLLGIVCAIAVLLAPWIGFYSFINYTLGVALVILFLGITTILGIIGFLSGDLKFSPEYLNKPVRKLFNKISTKVVASEAKAPSLIVEAYKAHKSKFCPLVEIED